MGKLLCLKTPLKKSRQIPPKSRKLVQAPGPSLWPSLLLLGELFTKPLAIMPSVMCLVGAAGGLWGR